MNLNGIEVKSLSSRTLPLSTSLNAQSSRSITGGKLPSPTSNRMVLSNDEAQAKATSFLMKKHSSRHSSSNSLRSLKSYFRKLRTLKGTVRAIINLKRKLPGGQKKSGSVCEQVARLSVGHQQAIENVRNQVKQLVDEGQIVTEIDPNSHLDVSILKQGNLEMYSQENLQKRIALQQNPYIIALSQRLWISAIKESEGKMTFAQYETFMLRLHRLILPEFEMSESKKLIRDDWNRDVNGQNYLEYAYFHFSMFELADLWTDSVESTHYISLLYCIAKCLTMKQHDRYMLRSLEDISPIDVLDASNKFTLEDIQKDLEDETKSAAAKMYKEQIAMSLLEEEEHERALALQEEQWRQSLMEEHEHEFTEVADDHPQPLSMQQQQQQQQMNDVNSSSVNNNNATSARENTESRPNTNQKTGTSPQRSRRMTQQLSPNDKNGTSITAGSPPKASSSGSAAPGAGAKSAAGSNRTVKRPSAIAGPSGGSVHLAGSNGEDTSHSNPPGHDHEISSVDEHSATSRSKTGSTSMRGANGQFTDNKPGGASTKLVAHSPVNPFNELTAIKSNLIADPFALRKASNIDGPATGRHGGSRQENEFVASALNDDFVNVVARANFHPKPAPLRTLDSGRNLNSSTPPESTVLVVGQELLGGKSANGAPKPQRALASSSVLAQEPLRDAKVATARPGEIRLGGVHLEVGEREPSDSRYNTLTDKNGLTVGIFDSRSTDPTQLSLNVSGIASGIPLSGRSVNEVAPAHSTFSGIVNGTASSSSLRRTNSASHNKRVSRASAMIHQSEGTAEPDYESYQMASQVPLHATGLHGAVNPATDGVRKRTPSSLAAAARADLASGVRPPSTTDQSSAPLSFVSGIIGKNSNFIKMLATKGVPVPRPGRILSRASRLQDQVSRKKVEELAHFTLGGGGARKSTDTSPAANTSYPTTTTTPSHHVPTHSASISTPGGTALGDLQAAIMAIPHKRPGPGAHMSLSEREPAGYSNMLATAISDTSSSTVSASKPVAVVASSATAASATTTTTAAAAAAGPPPSRFAVRVRRVPSFGMRKSKVRIGGALLEVRSLQVGGTSTKKSIK